MCGVVAIGDGDVPWHSQSAIPPLTLRCAMWMCAWATGVRRPEYDSSYAISPASSSISSLMAPRASDDTTGTSWCGWSTAENRRRSSSSDAATPLRHTAVNSAVSVASSLFLVMALGSSPGSGPAGRRDLGARPRAPERQGATWVARAVPWICDRVDRAGARVKARPSYAPRRHLRVPGAGRSDVAGPSLLASCVRSSRRAHLLGDAATGIVGSPGLEPGGRP